eukprot:CAMPEP_0174365654 /NCGR_PEP_ID=MMETSP0811_2-20130205/77956_1 /TAXON_ID=73025 ORGANISM="Eutreptiella gymnastica-like, Strain CCMP1594" /NCGR_SAMPLE_ID=MMETSP0811_2 /ASSEMBLY_ACC=CAM_ASM_000667 /LENGTH=73 /DNA_ID=CAMNT_0015506439 /DNA_START=507 /DNA_END=725 /DNA_ORIENTATION=+
MHRRAEVQTRAPTPEDLCTRPPCPCPPRARAQSFWWEWDGTPQIPNAAPCGLAGEGQALEDGVPAIQMEGRGP